MISLLLYLLGCSSEVSLAGQVEHVLQLLACDVAIGGTVLLDLGKSACLHLTIITSMAHQFYSISQF